MGKISVVRIKKTNYEKWLEFRKSGIGGSEIGTVMGVNPYMSSIELYYKKLGMFDDMKIENVAMFMGNYMESHVATLWKYYQHDDEEAYIRNYSAGNIQRECYEPRGYILNSDYPHLFFSPDRIMGNAKDKRGVLELKTISGWAAKQWEHGIPPSYIYQVVSYMIGLELNYGELCSLEDGRKLTVTPFEMDDSLQNVKDAIVEETAMFWERVKQGKAAMAAGEDYEQFAPPPDGSEAYSKFLNQKYKKAGEEIIHGSDEILEKAILHKKLSQTLKELENEKRQAENEIKTLMKESQILDFGKSGKVYWKGVGDTRRFTNYIKF